MVGLITDRGIGPNGGLCSTRGYCPCFYGQNRPPRSGVPFIETVPFSSPYEKIGTLQGHVNPYLLGGKPRTAAFLRA